jgi:hypothetical protein
MEFQVAAMSTGFQEKKIIQDLKSPNLWDEEGEKLHKGGLNLKRFKRHPFKQHSMTGF